VLYLCYYQVLTPGGDVRQQTSRRESSALVKQEAPTFCPRCRVNPDLLPNKLLYFAFSGGLGCALPYVAVYLKQMGLSPQEIGLISGKYHRKYV